MSNPPKKGAGMEAPATADKTGAFALPTNLPPIRCHGKLVLPFITDRATIARRERRKRVLQRQARALLALEREGRL